MPSPVDRYFKDVKKKNPSYSEEQAWATAWSIYCKHKNPGSDSCHKDTDEYLKKEAMDTLTLRVAARYQKACAGGCSCGGACGGACQGGAHTLPARDTDTVIASIELTPMTSLRIADRYQQAVLGTPR